MRYKRKILLLIIIAIFFIPYIEVHAVTAPTLKISSNNYSIGDEAILDDINEVECGKTLQLYGTIVQGYPRNDGKDIRMIVQQKDLEGIIWTSNNEGIAKVDSTGKVAGIAVGETTITAEYKSYSRDYEIKVTPRTGIEFLDSEDETIKVINKEYNFKIGLNNIPDSEKEKISIMISNENIAKITELDLCDSNVCPSGTSVIAKIKTISAGKTTITATINYNGTNYSDSYEFEVLESEYHLSLSTNGSSALPTSIAIGKQIQLKAILKSYNGSLEPEDVTDKDVTWESSDEKIATVDNKGLVSTIEKGTVTITAKYKINDEIVTTAYNLRVADTNNSTLIVGIPNTAAEKTIVLCVLGILMIFFGGGLIIHNLLKI